VETKTRKIDGYKVWLLRLNKAKNGVGILVDKEFIDLVVEVRHKNDHLMAIKIVLRSEILNLVIIYAP